MRKVSDKIKELRQERGWTQVQLAERINVSPQVISNWERDYTKLNHEDIFRLAKVFKVDPNEIYDTGDARDDKTIEFAKQIITKYNIDPADDKLKELIFDAIELGLKHHKKNQ